MPSQRETAKRERAEAREGRRNQSDESTDNGTSADEQLLDGLKQAAKVAAASVALGAVAAAARALAERRHSSDDESANPEAEPGESDEQNVAEAEPESTAEAQPEPERRPREEAPQEEREEQPRPEPRPQRPPPPRREPVAGASPDEARSVADAAQDQLQLLVGKEPETISALERDDDGWLVTLEVLEVSRIPESTDVLASYEVELDDDRNLRRYARVRRYHRSQADQDGRS